MKLILAAIALCGAIVFGVSAREQKEFQLPEGIPTCDQDDPNLNECIKKAIQNQLPKLHKGSKELGIPPLDPFTIASNRVMYSNGGIQGSVVVKGVKIYGLSRAEIRNVDQKIFESGMTIKIEVFIPRVYAEGSYKGDLKINELKMSPKGFFNVTVSAISITSKMAGNFETIDGKKYLKVISCDLIPEIGDLKVYASGLIPDPQLNSFVLDFINQYGSEMFRLIVPETRSYWEPVLLDNANQFLSTVPFDELLTKKQQ